MSTTLFGSTAPVSVPDVIFEAFKFVRVEPFQIKVPLARIFHTTSSFWVGVVVPIPTFPEVLFKIVLDAVASC